MPYLGKSPEFGVRERFYYTQTSAGATSISGFDDNGTSLRFTDGNYVDVYLNGVLLVDGVDYGTSTANTISSLSALADEDVIEIVVYDVFNLAKNNAEVTRTRYYKTASGSETTISGNDDSGVAITFPAGAQLDVSLNGVSLVAGTDYNTSTANTISGLSALSAGQVIEIVKYEKFVVSDTVSKSAGGAFGGAVSATSLTGVVVNAGRQSLASANGYIWTGIPSTAKKIIVVYRLFFTQSSTQDKTTLLRIGSNADAGNGIVTSGYESVSAYQAGVSTGTESDATGFFSYYWSTGTQNQIGKYELTYLHGNGWICSGQAVVTEVAGVASKTIIQHTGYRALSGALDRVEIKIKDGTTTYNANSEAVLYYMG
jgi:hypothetical protein